MNMLTDSVPESLTIAGTEYEINTDYRVWLKFETLLSDDVNDCKITFDKIKKLIFKSSAPPSCANEDFQIFCKKKSTVLIKKIKTIAK